MTNDNTSIEQGEELLAKNHKARPVVNGELIRALIAELKESQLELGLTQISRNGLVERLASCEAALNERDSNIQKSQEQLTTITAELNESNRLKDKYESGLSVANASCRRRGEIISDITAERDKLKLLVKDADNYLDTNEFTSIGHGSILHQEFKALTKE